MTYFYALRTSDDTWDVYQDDNVLTRGCTYEVAVKTLKAKT